MADTTSDMVFKVATYGCRNILVIMSDSHLTAHRRLGSFSKNYYLYRNRCRFGIAYSPAYLCTIGRHVYTTEECQMWQVTTGGSSGFVDISLCSS